MLAGILTFVPFPAAGKVGCAVMPESGKAGPEWLLQAILDASILLEFFLLSFLILFLPYFGNSFPSRSASGIKNYLLQSFSDFCLLEETVHQIAFFSFLLILLLLLDVCRNIPSLYYKLLFSI